MRRTLLVLGALLAVPAAAEAAPPDPFGHACTPESGVLRCRTASDAARVPSWDGVPLDVDVTLPGSGDGPFPTVVMMHGWGGNKGSFQNPGPYGDITYAQLGYAVVTYSARGFGRSCGTPDSRTSPGCDAGWLHLADHRYEARDTQHLLGLLVDQGVARADALGVTGVSYGGIQSLNLARLRDRIRLPDGSFQPWRSPNGTPLRIAAAWARWGASDLTYALSPNGRFTDFGRVSAVQSRTPLGVSKKSYNDGLYAAGNLSGFYAPLGSPMSANISGWKAVTDRGEPGGPAATAVARELTSFHSFAGLTGPSAPLLVQNGWTDDLFPAPEALRVYRTYQSGVELQLGDIGHARGSNKAAQDVVFNTAGARFFGQHLKGEPRPAILRPAVTAFLQTCPESRSPGRPFSAATWNALHPRSVRMAARRRQTVTSNGGNRAVAKALDPIGGKGACAQVTSRRARGTAIVQRRVRRPFTMIGLPTVRARIATRGRGGFVAARLFDVRRGKATLVSRGVYRLRDNQRGRITFQLFGNGWRFARGRTARLELVGRDPNFLRTSNNRFRVRVSRIAVDLPSR